MAVGGRPMNGAEWMLLVTLSLLWGGSFFFFKVLDAELPVFTIVFGRVAIAAVLLLLLLFLRSENASLTGLPWRQLVLMALINNVLPFSLFVFAETRITSGLASILNATTPVFTVIAAHFLTQDEKVTATKFAGVALAFAGVALLVGPQIAGGRGVSDVVAMSACLAAALLYAFAGIYGRRFRGLPPIAVSAGQTMASTAMLLPVVLAIDRPWTLPMPHVSTIVALIGLAFFSTVVAYIIYFRLLASAGATNLLLVTVLSPVSALILGVLFLREEITVRAVAGLCIIGAGLAAIDGRPPAALRHAMLDRVAREKLR